MDLETAVAGQKPQNTGHFDPEADLLIGERWGQEMYVHTDRHSQTFYLLGNHGKITLIAVRDTTTIAIRRVSGGGEGAGRPLSGPSGTT